MTQLNVDHTTENEDELFRLSQLGEGMWTGLRASGEADPGLSLCSLLVAGS